jgi:hypothetical protein
MDPTDMDPQHWLRIVPQGFSYYFCMMIEGSGSIPLTSGAGSGSWRPKNMWIRIRNTASELLSEFYTGTLPHTWYVLLTQQNVSNFYLDFV